VTKFMLKAVVLFALFVSVVAQAQTLPTFSTYRGDLPRKPHSRQFVRFHPVRRYYVRVGRPVRARRGHQERRFPTRRKTSRNDASPPFIGPPVSTRATFMRLPGFLSTIEG
jgi:hypothetical protein